MLPISARHGRTRMPQGFLAAAAAAAAAALVVGCASGSGGPGPTGPGGSGGPGAAGSSQGPRQAIAAAVAAAHHINSASTSLSERLTGKAAASIGGTIDEQLRPSLKMTAKLSTSTAGQAATLDVVITSKAAYVKVPILKKETGKPWLKIPLSRLKAGSINLGSLLRDLSSDSPLSQSAGFAAAKNARVVGTQTIDGVPTTRYAGSYSPQAALRVLPSSLRSQLAPALRLVQGPVRFSLWITSQHQIKKLAETEHVNGETVYIAVLIKSVNQPVQVTVPPASQVVQLPASQLGALG